MGPIILYFVSMKGKLCTFKSDKSIRACINYIAGEGKEKNPEKVEYIGAKGLNKKYDEAAKDIIIMQKHLQKNWDKRRGYHLIVAFPKEIDNVDIVIRIADIIGDRLFNDSKVQTFYGVHTNTDNLHIHYFINAVRYYDGKKYHFSTADVMEMKRWITEQTIEMLT